MRIHYFQHIPFEDLAAIEDWIHEKEHILTCTKFYEQVWFPQLNDIDWLIIMGGFMGAYEEDKFPWLVQEKEYIRSAIENNKIVLGICLGSQLIASALGARVYKNIEKEIGWHDVAITDAAKNIDLFNSLPDNFKFFQWHGDTFDLPHGAVRIAESEACKNQGFIYKDKVIGLQFHPEMTEYSVNQLINSCRDELVDSPFIQTEDQMRKNISLTKENNKIMIGILEKLESLNS